LDSIGKSFRDEIKKDVKRFFSFDVSDVDYREVEREREWMDTVKLFEPIILRALDEFKLPPIKLWLPVLIQVLTVFRKDRYLEMILDKEGEFHKVAMRIDPEKATQSPSNSVGIFLREWKRMMLLPNFRNITVDVLNQETKGLIQLLGIPIQSKKLTFQEMWGTIPEGRHRTSYIDHFKVPTCGLMTKEHYEQEQAWNKRMSLYSNRIIARRKLEKSMEDFRSLLFDSDKPIDQPMDGAFDKVQTWIDSKPIVVGYGPIMDQLVLFDGSDEMLADPKTYLFPFIDMMIAFYEYDETKPSSFKIKLTMFDSLITKGINGLKGFLMSLDVKSTSRPFEKDDMEFKRMFPHVNYEEAKMLVGMSKEYIPLIHALVYQGLIRYSEDLTEMQATPNHPILDLIKLILDYFAEIYESICNFLLDPTSTSRIVEQIMNIKTKLNQILDAIQTIKDHGEYPEIVRLLSIIDTKDRFNVSVGGTRKRRKKI